MHVLPNSKIPYANLTLDVLISNKSAALKKSAGAEGGSIEITKRSGSNPAPTGDGVFTIDEFNFPHAVALHDSALKAEPLIATFKKLNLFMQLDKTPGNFNFLLFQ
jgi:hypothetical protein